MTLVCESVLLQNIFYNSILLYYTLNMTFFNNKLPPFSMLCKSTLFRKISFYPFCKSTLLQSTGRGCSLEKKAVRTGFIRYYGGRVAAYIRPGKGGSGAA